MIPDLRNTKESPGHSPVTYRKMVGIVCFLLKIHPRRQCIRCLLLLFLGGDNRRAVALLGTVAAESGMTAAVDDRFGSVLWEVRAVGFVFFAVQYAVLAAVGGIDLQMSPGKLAAQCCHASLAFLTDPIGMGQGVEPIEKDGEITGYRAEIMLEKATYEEWFDGSFTKTICGAKNRNQLLKAKTIAEELGLVENKDFFLIRDACHTELEPEEFDENGEGMTLTCIGFRPLPDEIAHQISHKFHLY